MIKRDLTIGFAIGILACILGVFLFVTFFTDFGFIEGVQWMRSERQLGKLITMGAILDLIAFGILMKIDQEIMARGVVLGVICITIYTLIA